MRVRRCAALFFEAKEVIGFDLKGLIAGGNGLSNQVTWLAHAPHLDRPVPLDRDACAYLGELSSELWTVVMSLDGWPQGLLAMFIDAGLVAVEDGATASAGRDDVTFRSAHWWPEAAFLHRASRWEGKDAAAATEEAGLMTATGLRSTLGAPPPAVQERGSAAERVALPRPEVDTFDGLLSKRVTCRNFDTEKPLPLALLSQMTRRVFAAHMSWRLEEDTVFIKKSSPSGGSLHPIEAYLVVRNVDGLSPGVYHYHPIEHSLQCLDVGQEALSEDFARRMLAGQHWFADAPVLVVMVARFPRTHWKYQRHPKAYRAITMDAGHLSQTLYLSATDLGLGAFVTCAINEVDIDRMLGVDGMTEGAVAMCGFGWRTEQMRTTEFDPLGVVWEADRLR